MQAAFLRKEIWVLAWVNFLYCLGTYITLPILALYLHNDLSVPVTRIGVLLGLPPVIGAVCGSFGALLSRRLGAPNCLIIGLALLIAPYGALLFVRSYPLLLLLSGLLGLSRVFWNPIIKSLFADYAQQLPSPKLAFQVNYITICLGAVLGPLVAMGAFLTKPGHLLLSISLFTLVILILFAQRGRLAGTGARAETAESSPHLPAHVDRRLLRYILGGLLVFVVFSQFETVFSLALQHVSENPERLFSLLLMLNALAGIIFQCAIMWLGKRLSTMAMLLAGNLAFFLAFLLFARAGGGIPWLVVATLLFSIGEVLVIPSGDILIQEIAPAELRTRYFSLAELRVLGFSIGPIFASTVLQTYGASYMFLASTLVILLSSIIYALPAARAARTSLS